jgi:hypothetical protein
MICMFRFSNLIGKVRVKKFDQKNKKKQKQILILFSQMKAQNLKKISKIKPFLSKFNFFSSRLVNEIDEFDNDDALTSNNISVSSFRSAG